VTTGLRLLSSKTFDGYPKLEVIIGYSRGHILYIIDQINKATALLGVQCRFTEVIGNNIWITTSGMFDMHLLRYHLGNMPLKKQVQRRLFF
jgi:hypothetical protein